MYVFEPYVFARSDTAATIYFIMQFSCGFYSRAATNQEQCLLNSVFFSYVNVKIQFQTQVCDCVCVRMFVYFATLLKE